MHLGSLTRLSSFRARPRLGSAGQIALIGLLAGLSGTTLAGPVGADETQDVQATPAAGLTLSPGSSGFGPSAGQQLFASPLTGPAPSAADAASSAASASALAAELIKEAEAGAAAEASPEPSRSARRTAAQPKQAPTAAKSSTQGQADPAGDEGDLREMGKSALDWLKDRVPWLHGGSDASAVGADAAASAAGWSTPGLPGAIAAGAVGPGMAPDIVIPASPLAGNPGAQGSGQRDATALDRNLVREAVQLIREVFEHPMTWLIISLFVIGSVAISKFDRRPK